MLWQHWRRWTGKELRLEAKQTIVIAQERDESPPLRERMKLSVISDEGQGNILCRSSWLEDRDEETGRHLGEKNKGVTLIT